MWKMQHGSHDCMTTTLQRKGRERKRGSSECILWTIASNRRTGGKEQERHSEIRWWNCHVTAHLFVRKCMNRNINFVGRISRILSSSPCPYKTIANWILRIIEWTNGRKWSNEKRLLFVQSRWTTIIINGRDTELIYILNDPRSSVWICVRFMKSWVDFWVNSWQISFWINNQIVNIPVEWRTILF